MRATPSNPTGPAYRPGAPFRRCLAPPGARGRPLIVTGRVLHADGTPVRDAVLDVWHASDRGLYDMWSRQMRHRGRQNIDDEGKYRIETIEPHGYLWRPPHLHLKVHQGNSTTLTTQLYLPGHRRLAIDKHVDPLLVVQLEDHGNPLVVHYDLVLPS